MRAILRPCALLVLVSTLVGSCIAATFAGPAAAGVYDYDPHEAPVIEDPGGGSRPTALEQAGLQDTALVPIAATTVDLDLFVMPIVGGQQVPPVVWLAGYEVDRFKTFEDYVLAMIEYNARELAALRSG